MEKKNYSNNTIKQLKKENGTFTSNNKEILEEEYAFYKNLYKADDIPKEDIKTYLRDTGNVNILNEHEANTLEGIISETECQNALRNMKLNKSPGSDGLPVEFYVSFWQDVKTLVVESLNEGYEIGELSVTQKRGILNLIFKKEDKTLLSNWRPISLLNTDYKILAHVLANRLKKNIGKLVHTDQSGYIKGRNICFNIRLIQDVIDYFENGEQEGAIIFLDFQKAFDTVSHEFLMNALSRYNFGESFKKWVNVIYNKAESCVTNNGWTSKPLSINKGIRQGCPLSALLFLLVAEILAVRVRSNSNIGLKVETEENVKNIQISQLADDTTLFFKNENDILVGLKIVEQFSRVSGLKLNKRKSEGLWLGQGENRNDNSSNMPTHVKKQFRPFLLIDNKVEYNLPKKARDYYNIMISTTRKRTFLEKYWSNIFPDRPTWTKVYEGRFKNQNIKKLADFNFKIFHKILPCGENLFHWKISSTNKCRFGCPLTETYNHLFVTCPKQKDTIEKIERVLKSLGFELRLSYKILILGYKLSYHSYSEINQLLSHIFFAIYKYWIKNDYNLNKNNWIFSQLNQWQNIYSNTAWKFDLLDKFIAKWTEINTIK